MSKTLTNGIGAVAAGPVSFARTLPRVHIPVAQTRVAPSVQEEASVHTPSYGFMYLLKRVFAYSVDTTINLALLSLGLMVALWNQEVRPELLMSPSLFILGCVFCLIFNWALITAQEIAFSTSVGKRIFGLALRGETGALFIRAFFFIPSVLFCGIGLAWSIFDGRRRCWHDIVVNVQPLEIARL
jgi:hypothetical protein